METNYSCLLDDFKNLERMIGKIQSLYAGSSEYTNCLNFLEPYRNDLKFVMVDKINSYYLSNQTLSKKNLQYLFDSYFDLKNYYVNNFVGYNNAPEIPKIVERILESYEKAIVSDVDFIMNHLSELLISESNIKSDDLHDPDDNFLKVFFKPENELLPPEDYIRFENLLYSSDKKVIDIKKEPGKIFAVLMVLAENNKIDLSEYDHVKKSNELNVKVAHFMAKHFTYQGEKKDNRYYNSDVFPLISTRLGAKYEDFNKQLNLICGKIGFNLPQKIKLQP